MNATGAVTSRHDYLPFGEELGAGTGAPGSPTGMRTTAQGYSAADNVRQRYADTRLDDATGLDHTLWRKLETRSGRWTTPDPYGKSLRVANPQSFNRFAYVHNDPGNLVDPSGLDPQDPAPTPHIDPATGLPYPGGVPGVNGGVVTIQDSEGSLAGIIEAMGFGRGSRQVLTEGEARGSMPQQLFPPINVDKLRELIGKTLEFSDCKEWVAALISKAAELSGGSNPAVGTDILDTFDRVRNQPNGGFIFALDTRVAGGGGTTDGYWHNGSITIRITPLGYFSDNPHGADYIPIHYGLNGLHELVHASGQNALYTEPDLLRAAQALDPNGEYHDWNTALKDHCAPE